MPVLVAALHLQQPRLLPLLLSGVRPAARPFTLACGAVVVTALAGACSDAKERPPAAPRDAGVDVSTEVVVLDAGDVADAGARCALPASFGSTKCNECVATHCCAPLAACAADAACRALRDCNLPCLDAPDAPACSRECRAKYPDDGRLWYDIETCWTFSDPCTFHCAISP